MRNGFDERNGGDGGSGGFGRDVSARRDSGIVVDERFASGGKRRVLRFRRGDAAIQRRQQRGAAERSGNRFGDVSGDRPIVPGRRGQRFPRREEITVERREERDFRRFRRVERRAQIGHFGASLLGATPRRLIKERKFGVQARRFARKSTAARHFVEPRFVRLERRGVGRDVKDRRRRRSDVRGGFFGDLRGVGSGVRSSGFGGGSRFVRTTDPGSATSGGGRKRRVERPLIPNEIEPRGLAALQGDQSRRGDERGDLRRNGRALVFLLNAIGAVRRKDGALDAKVAISASSGQIPIRGQTASALARRIHPVQEPLQTEIFADDVRIFRGIKRLDFGRRGVLLSRSGVRSGGGGVGGRSGRRRRFLGRSVGSRFGRSAGRRPVLRPGRSGVRGAARLRDGERRVESADGETDRRARDDRRRWKRSATTKQEGGDIHKRLLFADRAAAENIFVLRNRQNYCTMRPDRRAAAFRSRSPL